MFHASLSILPDDIILDVAYHLQDIKQDVLNYCLTSNRFFSVASSVLYSQVTLNSVENTVQTLDMLKRSPHIARHVRELVVRHRIRDSAPSQNSYHNNILAASAVRDVAASGVLDALSTFAWDHEELPYDDAMWEALRLGCLQLRYLSTSFGTFTASADNHLFKFEHLLGFSLFLSAGFYDIQQEMLFRGENPIPQTFWDMLIHHSPNLETLSIDGASNFPADAHQLVHARWPNLKSLSLGDVLVDWDGMPARGDSKRPFIEFLEAHTSLKNLRLAPRVVSSSDLATLDPDAFSLTSFCGTLPQLQAIPFLHAQLRSVSFRSEMQTQDMTTLASSGLLKDLRSLDKLKISFMLHSAYDSGNLLRSLIASCPHLRHLELTCGHKPSFQINSFSRILRGFHKLRVLRLTIVKYPGDALSSGAARIALMNPQLEKFSLTFLSPSTKTLPFTLFSKDMGSFTLTRDAHGLPLTMQALERRRVKWPLGLGDSYKTRRYVSDLRPRDVREKRGVASILLENSVAGEELRMITVCGLLTCLALWGCLTGK